MEKFDADNIFDPRYYFSQGSATVLDPTSQLTSDNFPGSPSHPAVANRSLITPSSLDLHSNRFVDSFNSSIGIKDVLYCHDWESKPDYLYFI